MNILSAPQERKSPQGKSPDFLFRKLLKIAFSMRNLTHRLPQSGHFSQILGIFFQFSKKSLSPRGKLKHELRVQIQELRVQIYELRVQIHESED